MNWKFWRWKQEGKLREAEQRARRASEAVRAAFDWDDKMVEMGFRHWYGDPPPHGVTLELMRRTWATIDVCDRDKVRPEMNCYGLWWRIADGPLTHSVKVPDLSLMAPIGSA